MATTIKKIKKRRARLTSLDDRARLLSAFGRRLLELRLKSGLSPTEFEAKSGIDAGNLAKYEQGLREPGLVVIFIMARALEIRPSELVEFDVPDSQSEGEGSRYPKDPVELLRSLMKERNMKSKDLAELLGVSKGFVSNLLHGRKDLSKGNLKVLAEYFKIDVGLLIRDKR